MLGDCGSAGDVNERDLLEYLSEALETRVITANIEGVEDRSRFFKPLWGVSQTKPVILWKEGLTQGSTRAVHPDTASLGGEEEELRPRHSECRFCREGLCANMASLFHGQVRVADAPVCSVFQMRDDKLKKEANNGNC